MTIDNFSAILSTMYERYNKKFNLAREQYNMTENQKDFLEMCKATGGIMAIVDIQQDFFARILEEGS